MEYYEDLEPGSEREIGRHFVSREEIIRFAEQWDPQPFHLDDAAAEASVFGTLTASSCHIYSISALIFSKNPSRLRAAAMMGTEIRFPAPLRPEDTLTLIECCLEKRRSRSRRGYGVVKGRSTLRNQEGRDVCVMDTTYLVECRDPDGDD